MIASNIGKRHTYFSHYEIVSLVAIIASLFILSGIFQAHTLFSWDVSWGLIEAQRLLAGGTYNIDFFEPSPPMFLYIYSIPVMLSQLLTINVMLIFKLFIFFISFISLGICYTLTTKIFSVKDKTIAGFFLVMLATTFVLLPLPYDFGQREQLLLIFIMPYLLLTHCRLANQRIAFSFAIFIGIIAGIGFVIKPFFVITFLLIEIYYLYCKRNVFAGIRAETIVIISILVSYLLLILACYPSYFTITLPTAARFYHATYFAPWKAVLLRPELLFCELSLLFYLLQYKNNSYKPLITIFAVALMGLLISYFLHHTSWYYQLYPAYSLAILLVTLLFSFFTLQVPISRLQYIVIALFGLLVYGFLFYNARLMPSILTLFPSVFFYFFGITFTGYLFFVQQKKNLFLAIGSTLIIIAISLLCAHLTLVTGWPFYLRFYFVLLILVLLLSLLLPKTNIPKLHYVFSAVLAVLIFSFPYYQQHIRFYNAVENKKSLHKLHEFMLAYTQHKSVYFLTSTFVYEFPLVHYVNAIPTSKFAALAWLPGMITQMHSAIETNQRLQLEEDKKNIVSDLAQEINTKKPAFIFVDTKENKQHFNHIKFDYLQDFSQYNVFKTALNQYRYFTTIEEKPYYTLQVYQRING